MKYISILILTFMTLSVFGQDYKIYKGDTINRLDNYNRKQGLWLKFDDTYDDVIEQGEYTNNHKQGIWISYYPDGKKKNEITYKNGKAIGKARFFYSDGTLSEEGYWDVDHWEGEYKFYHKSGQLAYDWNYDTLGRRTGTQKYYHENGELKYEGDWDEGKTRGTLKMFSESGQLISERIYDEDGKFASNVEHQPEVVKEEPEKHHEEFIGTGMHTIYNMEGRPEKKGFFVRGKLFNGELFEYNETGELLYIEYYQNGELKRTEAVKNPG
ncbi:toxin-antitoxin system YwqK family antitoxin [Carboxylicivirga linearis]|uniref:Toxin-antitoxin system YwqK family antitoxin n=1 Tax=Carboxylicivirga linearis TaxID=1628157 RepID=A0ABS5K2T3_9BACT|nr:toxin-antitoxin system YwqK family antitoxin [Carboxylicivirga linearis]MBS2100811.1 toxin-antitoxin system YwqK family antitoxin [Carboxylicivirga linearis]